MNIVNPRLRIVRYKKNRKKMHQRFRKNIFEREIPQTSLKNPVFF
ncbi:MAG: hypothetical protein UAR70_01345 [Buchnera aphidicola (Chaetogeoica yunlongensis)]